MDLGLQTAGSKSHASLLRRLNIPPGQHGPRGMRKMSDFGTQLREKQKVKRMYGILERQFRKYFDRAKKWRGNTGEKLIEFLESRLDNVLYRLGFVPTRPMARQFISHGHVLVNGKKVSIPSFAVSQNQVITLSAKAMKHPAVAKLLEDKAFQPPEWLAREAGAGKVVRLPGRSDVKESISEQFIIEHYSR